MRASSEYRMTGSANLLRRFFHSYEPNALTRLTDVQMPGLSGIELQDVLTARGHVTPIIFITAFADKVRQRALDAGAIGVLGKPYKEECLIDCLDAALKIGKDAGREQ